jgi:hypothetical protein
VDDHCDGQGICTGGSLRDCSGDNLVEIAACDNNPDSNPFTFDYAAGFTSTCDEVHKMCTNSSYNYTHTCADSNSTDNGPAIPVGNGIRTCTAECDGFGTECQNKCVNNVRYFSGACNLTSCGCSYSTENCDSQDDCYAYQTGCEDRDYYCTLEGCNYTFSNRNTDYNDSSDNYCSADMIRKNATFHDFSCDGTCKDHTNINDTLVQNCSLQDGWYNTTVTKWVDMCDCTEVEQVKQEYRDYTCTEPATCNYAVTNTTWINTGNVKQKPDVFGPMTYSLSAQTVCVRMDCSLLNIKATVKDSCSNVSESEYFFDTCPSVSTRGTSMLASDGAFDEKTEDVYKNLVNVSALTEGKHTLYIRGKDDKNNWGTCAGKICYMWKSSKFCL